MAVSENWGWFKVLDPTHTTKRKTTECVVVPRRNIHMHIARSKVKTGLGPDTGCTHIILKCGVVCMAVGGMCVFAHTAPHLPHSPRFTLSNYSSFTLSPIHLFPIPRTQSTHTHTLFLSIHRTLTLTLTPNPNSNPNPNPNPNPYPNLQPSNPTLIAFNLKTLWPQSSAYHY